LEQEKHSAEPKLKEVCRNLTELLHPVHEELLNPVPFAGSSQAKHIRQNDRSNPP
jgi:hypothetical protein